MSFSLGKHSSFQLDLNYYPLNTLTTSFKDEDCCIIRRRKTEIVVINHNYYFGRKYKQVIK